MATYAILSTLPQQSTEDPRELRELADAVSQKIKAECPGVRWNSSYVLLGRYHALDIVEADSPADVEKVAAVIERHAHATTETMRATPRAEFLANVHGAQGAGAKAWRWELGHSGGF